jgi:hypothetical protein
MRSALDDTLKGSIPVTDVSRSAGQHPSSAVRWATRGVRLRDGTRLRLQAFRAPGGWRTRPEWVQRFLDSLTTDAATGEPTEVICTPTRSRAADVAAAACVALGL